MGEIAEMMLDGTLCQYCGACIIEPDGTTSGRPSSCKDCEKELRKNRTRNNKRNLKKGK